MAWNEPGKGQDPWGGGNRGNKGGGPPDLDELWRKLRKRFSGGGPSSYGIFDTFADDAGRDAHLSGKVAEALMEQAPDLFAKDPEIHKLDVLAAKGAS